MRHLSKKILCLSLSLSNIAFMGLLPGGLSAFAQGTPLPQNQPALINTQVPSTVLEILMRQDQAIKKKQQQAAVAKTALNKKPKKNKTHPNSEIAALPEISTETKSLAKKKSKTNTTAPMANVGLPIAIPNRIDDLSAAEPAPDLKPTAEMTTLADHSDVLPLRGMSAIPSRPDLSPSSSSITTIPEMRLSPAKVDNSTAPSFPTTSASSLSTIASALPSTSNRTTLTPSPYGTLGTLPNEALPVQGAILKTDSLKTKTALYLDNLNEKFQAWKEKPREPVTDHVRNIVDTVINTSHESNHNGRPLHYEALPGIAIFPVIRHGEEKAFGDMPLLFAREYSNKIASVVSPETHIYNPIYTVESIKQKGIGAIYDEMMEYYIRSGRPEPKATHWLLKQITESGYPISRIMFVESDVDMNNPEASTGFKDRVQALLMDANPRHIKMMVKSRVQVFDTESANMPRLWGGSWQRSVDFSNVRNITKSVYDDTDSERSFSSASRRISQELLYAMPRTSYMTPVYDTGVHAEVLKTGNNNDSTTIEASIKPAGLNSNLDQQGLRSTFNH